MKRLKSIVFILSCTKRETCLCFPFYLVGVTTLFGLDIISKIYIAKEYNPKEVFLFELLFRTLIKSTKPQMPLIISPNGLMTESPLTPRERDVLELIAKGLKQRQIAVQLLISMETARKHIKNAYKKLGAHNKVDALRKSGIW
jgi:DNA-binding CsgD family transcriptional regulator